MGRLIGHGSCQSDMTSGRVAASFRGGLSGRGGGGRTELLPGLFTSQPRLEQFIFRNRTELDSARLREMILGAIDGWPADGLSVLVRYSRGAEFSGACYYKSNRIFVNLGRENTYPYRLATYVAAARSTSFGWKRPVYSLEISDAYRLALFIFLHEFYHWLVKRAGRNTRQKEGMCDRFAARVLVDQWGASMTAPDGGLVRRRDWDFQDLDGFVGMARWGKTVRSRGTL